ncbi:NAD(P)-dependent dehydrogenase (short-subunit alcohol dehydrogenase family) [Tenacibaculum adriaticum]|uniref:NAD(P)-dependent dehydrogenase (Short-subunit alcohol dehydrogenase family) n=1 Tax=Tenacibaculum adriaticum TaxID=413713 RepID=A0A5S5DV32_9FLAO|nr:glucose 1-dehydrogenase [Tenacibaculum adriaticum]TYP99860.1 NAD(P)-dependent dehydrogenase (short-subunit alcohol dehydrogenase family) [Tenacibaculum adriaticum]
MEKKLENRVSIITGAGSGIGKSIALLFASEGSKIVAADINQERLDVLEKEIREIGGEIATVISDISKEDDIKKMINTATSNYGTLDILVNNAGIMDNFEPADEVSNQLWEKIMKVNVDGPFKAIRSALKIFLPQQKGVIINIASLGGINGARAGAAYTTSKHALVGLTKNTGYMYAKLGIRCNAIAPGAVETNISDTIDFTKVSSLVNDRIMPGMALNPRTANPTEIAKVALFLASDDSSFVNGEVLVADGGWGAY